MAKIQIKRGLQEAVEHLVLSEGELAVALDTGNFYVGATAGKIHINPKIGTADVADTLSTPRAFSISGDATATEVNFDGSDDVELVLTLADILNLQPGTYTKVSVDSKGRVTTGSTLEVTDLPDIPSTKITGLGTAATHDVGSASDNVITVQSDGKILESLIPDLSGTYVPTDRTINGHSLNDDIILTAEDVEAISSSEKGKPDGVATLDGAGKVPSAQLPSYVDDVVEYENREAFPETGEAGVIYVTKDTNLTYRWSGSDYIEISASLALGTTASTAFAGDKGQESYEHSQLKNANPHNTTAEQVGAAPASHTEAMASSDNSGHIKLGIGMSVSADGVLSIDTIDGGTF